MRFLSELPRQRTPWPARLLALALGVLGPMALALTAVRQPASSYAPDEREAAERVVAFGVPVPPAVTVPRVDDASPTRGASVVPPTAPRERSLWTGPVQATPARADSSGGGDSAAATPAHVPRARELFGTPAAGRALCLPPCGGTGPTIATGAAGRAGPGIVFAPMSREQRDSISHAVIIEAAAIGGREAHGESSLPPGAVGVSIPVGLPGGGPTRAQRERARVLDADVSLRLARIRARADSIAALRRRDSVARAMPRVAAPGTPGAPG